MALNASHDAAVIEFEFDDPFVDDRLTHIDERVAHYTSMGFHGNPEIDLRRVRRGRLDWSNPATRAICADLPVLPEWLKLVPTAAALDPLYDPRRQVLANGFDTRGELTDWFNNLVDARGIRSRAAAFRQVAVADAMTRDRPARWLSLACGAAHPALQAVTDVRRLGGAVPRMTLVDLDPTALALAQSHATAQGVDTLQLHRMDILGRSGFRPSGLFGRRAAHLPPASYDMVEAIGLLEYLRIDDWTYRYNKVVERRRPMAGARTFLRHAWELVAPGGHLVVGNMLTTHPQLGFTLNVIQWPHIQPRDVPTMLQLLDDAGIHGERTTYLPQDGAYALYVVRRPG